MQDCKFFSRCGVSIGFIEIFDLHPPHHPPHYWVPNATREFLPGPEQTNPSNPYKNKKN